MTSDSGSVGVLADDLIWASRLIEAVRRAGASPLRLGSSADLERALTGGGVTSAGSAADAGGSASPTGSAADDGSVSSAGTAADAGSVTSARSAVPAATATPDESATPLGDVAPADVSLPLRGVIVDLLGRRYDGVAAVERVHRAGIPVIAVAEHDDLATRKGALAAGARRVFSYNKFSTDGARLVATWLSADGGEP